MTGNPIIEELHQIRAEFAARFNYDITALVEYLREQQAQAGQPVVSFSAKQVVSDGEVIEERAA